MDKTNELNKKELHLSYNSLKNKLINEKRLQSTKFDSVVIDWLNQEMWSTMINDVIQLDIVKSNKQLLNKSQKEIFIKNIELLKKYLGESSTDKIKFEQGFTVNEVIAASDKLNGWVEEIKNARIRMAIKKIPMALPYCFKVFISSPNKLYEVIKKIESSP